MLLRAILAVIVAAQITMAAPAISPNPYILLSILTNTIVNDLHSANKFEWGVDKLRGVNIGGWLVLEP
jgi:hypothetical protein